MGELTLNDLRYQVLRGEEVTLEQYAVVIEDLRRSRTAAPSVAEKKAKKAASSAPIDLETLIMNF